MTTEQPENQNGTATARRQIVMQHSLVGWQDVGEPPTLHFEFQAAFFAPFTSRR